MMAERESRNQINSSIVSPINFQELFDKLNIKTDENVIEKRNVLKTKMSHLNSYRVSCANKSIINVFNDCDEIGNGAFGEVFKASDPFGNNYAFKRIKLAGKEDKDQEMMREVIAHQKLKHENVINFYDYWIEIENKVTVYLYLFMELCVENLADWLNGNRSI